MHVQTMVATIGCAVYVARTLFISHSTQRDIAMAPLPLQVRLEPHHLTALDGARVVTDPASGLTVTLSRQQVLLGILDQWIAAQQPQLQAVSDTDTDAPQKATRQRKRLTAPAD